MRTCGGMPVEELLTVVDAFYFWSSLRVALFDILLSLFGLHPIWTYIFYSKIYLICAARIKRFFDQSSLH